MTIPCGVIAGSLEQSQSLLADPHVALVGVVVVTGKIVWSIPELGAKSCELRTWALIADQGPKSVITVSPDSRGIAFGIPNHALTTQGGPEGWRLPSRLACLNCPRRDASLWLQGGACARMVSLADSLSSKQTDNPVDVWMAWSQQFELIARVFSRPELQAQSSCNWCCNPKDREAIESVAAELRAHYAEEHRLGWLARKHHINECALKQGFRARFGSTVFSYLREIRMQQAWLMLESGEHAIIEVANAVGYSNPSHFSRAFREVHGCNPSEMLRSGNHSFSGY
jgi:AraC-like DNA-binding protein